MKTSLLDKLDEIKLPTHGSQYKEFLNDGGTVISPSGLRNIIDNPSEWKKNVINKEKTFFGNKNTQIGSYVHLYCDYFYQGKLTTEKRLPKEIKNLFFSQNKDINLLEFLDKKETIRMDNYLEMLCDVVREEYLELYPEPLEAEGYIEFKLDDKTLIAGSFDVLSEECDENIGDGHLVMTDFKTTDKTLKPESMLNYILQLSVYCRLYELNHNLKPTKIRIVGIVKNLSPKIQILECKPNYELASKIVTNAYNAIRFDRGEDLTRDEIKELIFRENIYSFTTDKDIIKKIIGDVTITTSEERKVKKVIQSVFG